MITNISLGIALLGVVWLLWRETKSWFKFLDSRKPVYEEGEEEDRDS